MLEPRAWERTRYRKVRAPGVFPAEPSRNAGMASWRWLSPRLRPCGPVGRCRHEDSALAFLHGDGELDAPEASGTGQTRGALDAIITGGVPKMVTVRDGLLP